MEKAIKTKVDEALKMYEKGDITIGKAAEIAKKDLREMMIIASKRGIPLQYSLKDLMEDFEAIKSKEEEK